MGKSGHATVPPYRLSPIAHRRPFPHRGANDAGRPKAARATPILRPGYLMAFTVSLTMRGVRKISSSDFSLERPVCLNR